jgi:putative ABC transport system permease protein
MRDLRYAIRVLLKHPGFTAVAVLTLALGVGLNTALFSVVNSVLLAPLPFPDSGALVDVSETHKGRTGVRVSTPNFRDWRSGNSSFLSMAAHSQGLSNIGGGISPVRTPVAYVTSDFFPTLGSSPVLGRTFTVERDYLAVIGYGLWQRTFGGDPNVLGKALRMDGLAFTVVGVMPSGFDFPQRSEVWIPAAVFPDSSGRSGHNWRVVGRLKPGVTLAAAQSDMDAVAKHIREQDPSDRDAGCSLTSLHESIVGRGGMRTAFLVLSGAVIFVLLIACVNVANLQLSRAASREREIAIRVSLGASRGRLIRQLLTENIMLALAGGSLGLLLAYWATGMLRSFVPANITRVGEIGIDGRVLLFTLVVALATGIVFGIVPALAGSKTDLRSSMARRGSSLGGVLVSAEIALAMVLLVGAGLLLQSFWRLARVDPGFQTRRVFTADITWPLQTASGDVDRAQIPVLYGRLFDRLRALPGVQAVAATSALPVLNHGSNGEFAIEGREASKQVNDSFYRVITPDYFRALGIPLSRGRAFSDHDDSGSSWVAVVNSSFARQFFPDQDAVGKRIRYFGFDQKPQWLTIVGVSADSRDFGLNAPARSTCFVSFLQHSGLMTGQIIVRAPSADGIVEAVQSVNRDVPVAIHSVEEIVASSMDQQRFQMRLLMIFGGVALLLAAVGIYGVLSYAVDRQTRDVGIRMALGALPRQVMSKVMRDAAVLTLAGLAAGIAGAFALTRTLSSFLYGITATDPLTFASVGILLLAVALMAGYLPARRATQVDPSIALHYE